MTDQNDTPATQDQTVAAETVAGDDSAVATPTDDGRVDIPVETPAEEDTVPEVAGHQVQRVCLNVTLEREFREPKGKDSEFNEPISLLRVTADDLNKLSENYPKVDITKDAESRIWVQSLRDARDNALIGGALSGAVHRDEADWGQSVTQDAVKLAPGRPAMGGANSDQKLTGHRAVIKMQAALGLGSMVQVPLWHSGLWVSINAPTDAMLLNLERRIAEEKVTLGRMTNGLIFSHSSVYIVNHLLTLLMDSIYDVTVKDYTADKLLDLIKVTDLPVLVWGLAASIYPSGYDFRQPCVNNPDKCMHITEEKLNISRLFFFDRKGVNAEQRKHMVDRTKKHAIEDILKYHQYGRGGDGRVVVLNDDVTLVLKVPTLREYIRSGYTWIESIEKMVNEVLTNRPTDNEKNDFITQHSIVTLFRQYAHWVSKIVFRGNEEITDAETIEEVLSMLSTDQKLYEKFFDEVKKYIDDCTVAMIALPSYDCPKCGTPMTAEDAKHPNLIPLEVISLFFTLVHRRLDRTRL